MKQDILHIKILETIEKHKLFSIEKDQLLIGVSGGIDSMVLLHVLYSLGFNVHIAHCNFNLRGEESNEDQNFMEKYAKTHAITFHTKSFDTISYSKQNTCSIEMAARKLRYDWFTELCTAHSYSKIVIAHNENDTIETFFINLLRGSGIKGLQGIPIVNGNIVRPLLHISRKEIEAYAHSHKIIYRTDSSNLSNDYVRNKIRNIIIPELSNINETACDSIRTSMKYLEKTYTIYNATIAKLILQVSKSTARGIEINETLLLQNEYASTLLFEILHPLGFNSDSIQQILSTCSSQSGKRFESETHFAIHDRNTLFIEKKNCSTTIFSIEITDSSEQKIDTSFGTILLSTHPKESIEISKNKHIATLDLAKIIFPITIRTWKQGDSFTPFGMKGKKKISDFLIDEKIPLHKKDNILVVESANEIIWVIGYRISQNVAIENETHKVLKMIFAIK